MENVSCEEPAERKEGTGRNETKRNQNELKQNEECAWLTEKKCKCLGGGQVKRESERERDGEETFAHCGQKLENANKCKLAIFISLSPRVFFFAFSELFFSRFIVALSRHEFVT